MNKVEESCVGPSSNNKKKRNRASILAGMGIASRLSDVGRIMSKDQLQVDASGRKPSVSPSPSMRGSNDLSSNLQSSKNNDTSHDVTDHAAQQSYEADSRQIRLLEASAMKFGDTPGRSPSSISDNTNTRSESNKYSPSIKRSESAKDPDHRKNFRRGGIRKNSDPNLGNHRARLSLDADQVSKSGSSSSSSIAEVRQNEANAITVTSSSPENDESDLEAEQEPPDWRNSLTQEQLASLSSKEAKRQDVINELFHTERSHVRNLKVSYYFSHIVS